MSLRTGAIYSTCRYVDINTCTFFNTTITVSVLGSVQFWIKLVFLLLVSEEEWIKTNLQLKTRFRHNIWGLEQFRNMQNWSQFCKKALRTVQWSFRKEFHFPKVSSVWMHYFHPSSEEKKWFASITTCFRK